MSGDQHALLEAALSGRYLLERELGRGGMATVYLARDVRHDRPVALKVLHPELAATLGPDRFQREIRLAARLQHPHILGVYDSGEAAGRLWFTMPYVEGESVRDRLDRERQLPIADAVRLTREAALALDFAHRHGAVHRDIKPANILLVDGQALVADFGIARAVGGDDQGLTETGLAIGTPAYMSPEQAAGDKQLDARTDIYSLGVVLYEMLAGEPPFAAPSAQAMIARRLTEAPRPLREIRETVPEGVSQAVNRALAKAPADRFPSAAEFARALEEAIVGQATGAEPSRLTAPATPVSAVPAGRGRRRVPLTLVLAVGFVLGLGVLFGWLRSHGGAEPTGPGTTRLLAVLPFENLGSADDEYFADGVSDEIRGKLAALPGLRVTARSSSNQYKKTAKEPEVIGRELGVDYLLTGTVRWEKGAGGSRVRVSPELIRVATGSTEWQEPFDAALTEVFQVQAEVAGRVAKALDLALGSRQQAALAEKPTTNPAAYDAYLRGEAASLNMGSGDPERLQAAIDFYERAVALDSGFVQAWAQLSRAHSLRYVNGVPSVEGERRAREAAERALRLAPSHPIAHLAQGDYQVYIQRENEGASRAYGAGLRFAPDDPDLLQASAVIQIRTGRWEEGLAQLTRAQALDPRSVVIARRRAYSLLRLRRYPEALAASDYGLALDPTNLNLFQNKAMALLGRGDLEGARSIIREPPAGLDPTAVAAGFGQFYELSWALPEDLQALQLRLTPAAFSDRRNWATVQADAYRLRGDLARARAYADSARIEYEALLRSIPDDAQSQVFLGVVLAQLGRKAEAVAAGERALALVPMESDAFVGPYYQHQLVRIYILVGEPEKALDRLEPLLRVPYNLSPGWLRIDPNFDPIRKHPRFQRLVEGTS
ncbi:MAG: protein kinase [Gemmatimonadales bacterium]|nr:protein kinase [Gemmatimonadales bacterium]